MMLPPLPSAKSYHTFLVKSTLNDAVFSVCSGDKYHHLFPFSVYWFISLACEEVGYLDCLYFLYSHNASDFVEMLSC